MKKSNNIIFILIFIIFSISILLFNLKMKPFDVKKRDVNETQRDLLYTVINAGKEMEFDSVVIGGSSVTSAIRFYDGVEKEQSIMCLNPQGIAPIELYDLLNYFLKLHPEVKNIYVSLEFNTYFTCFKGYTIPRKPTNSLQDFIKLYFSLDATINSLNKFLKNMESKKGNKNTAGYQVLLKSLHLFKNNYNSISEYNNLSVFKKIYNLIEEYNLQALYFIFPVHNFIKLYFSFDSSINSLNNAIENTQTDEGGTDTKAETDAIESFPSCRMNYDSICENDSVYVFQKIYDLIQEHNLQALYFIPPVHALYLSDAVKGGYYKNIENFKKKITNITPYWDMSFVNYYTSLPLEYLFIDVYHMNGDFVSNKIKKIIYGKEKDDSFAVFVTKDNVDEVLKKQHLLIDEYIKNNQELVENHYNNNYDGTKKITYIKDYPKNLQDMYYENMKN